MKKGLLIILSGPSGVGKKTIWSQLMQDPGLNLSWSVSMTTREKRKNEIDGKDYYFVTKSQFEEAIKNNLFLEWAIYAGNYYGTPLKYVDEKLKKGKNVLLEIECQGAFKVIQEMKNTNDNFLTVFIEPPTLETLKQRLLVRGTEDMKKIEKRIEQARWEITTKNEYKYVIVNNNVQDSVFQLRSIIRKEIFLL